MTAIIVILAVVLLAHVLGVIHLMNKVKVIRADYAADQEAADMEVARLQRRIGEKDSEINRYLDTIDGTMAVLSEILPGVSTDTTLRNFAHKVAFEVYSIREEMADARVAAALETPDPLPLPDRIRSLSARAATHDALCEYLKVEKPFTYDGIVQAILNVGVKERTAEAYQNQVKAAREWLGAKDGESLQAAVQRVILTLETQPGADQELLKVRQALDIAPGQSVLAAIQEPMEFTVMVNRVHGRIVGAAITSEREWPVIGESSVHVKDLP